MHFANRPANVCVGADVSSAQAERKLGSTLTAAQEDVTTREGLDCVGRDWEGHDFQSCRQALLTFAIPSEARNLLFSAPTMPAATQKFEHHPSPVQGRNNDSPARKCRVSHGSRPRALRAPLFNLDQPDVITTMTAPLATRAGHPLDSPSHLKHNASYFPARTYRSFLCRASIVR